METSKWCKKLAFQAVKLGPQMEHKNFNQTKPTQHPTNPYLVSSLIKITIIQSSLSKVKQPFYISMVVGKSRFGGPSGPPSQRPKMIMVHIYLCKFVSLLILATTSIVNHQEIMRQNSPALTPWKSFNPSHNFQTPKL